VLSCTGGGGPGGAPALAEVLPEPIALAAYAFITGSLLDDPIWVGKPLAPRLAPAWSARRGDYRVLYLIDDDAREVRVTAIRRRGDAYRRLPEVSPFRRDPNVTQRAAKHGDLRTTADNENGL
jgi:mRNA-degrading endonuclease RelE of RelBE toxin-antitoxin system